MEPYDQYDSMRFHAWNHDRETFHAIPYMEQYDSIHGSAWNQMIPCMERYGTNEKQKFEILKISKYRSTSVSLSGNNWKTTGFELFELENEKRYNKA